MSARLLVVDDEPSMLDMLSLLWRAEGYEVETARSVGEARERINLNVPPLLALEAMAVSLQVPTPSSR